MRGCARVTTFFLIAAMFGISVLVSAQTQSQDSENIVITRSDLSPFTGTALGRFAQGFQYQYQYLENPNLIQIKQGTSQLIIPNPEHNLNQHSLTFDFKQVFLNSKVLSQALQNAYDLKNAGNRRGKVDQICGDMSVFDCVAVGGSRLGRALSGLTVTATLSERAAVSQGVLVPEGSFSNHYAIAGEVKFDPSQVFLTGTDWKAAADAIIKMKLIDFKHDKGLKKYEICTDPTEVQSLIQQHVDKPDGPKDWWRCVSDLAGTRHKGFIALAFLPTIDFKRQTQFDFVQYSGLLSGEPLEAGLNTLTFTWDLRRAIASASTRSDAFEALKAILQAKQERRKDEEAAAEKVESQKVCVTMKGSSVNYISVPDSFKPAACENLRKEILADRYELACSTAQGWLKSGSAVTGEAASKDLPFPNPCKWSIERENIAVR